MQSAVPSLDEKVLPIVVGRRFATPQEARAIEALQAVLDDQPPPARTAKPVYRAPAISQPAEPAVQPPAPVMKEVDVQVMHDEVTKLEEPTPVSVAPEFERMTVATTRDEMLAVVAEVAARSTPPSADTNTASANVAAITKVADLMPFGAATLRLFCC